MTTIIHGDDTAAAIKKLDEYLSSSWVVRIDGKKTNTIEITQSFQTDSLFTESRTIIVEQIKSLSKPVLDVLVEKALSAPEAVNVVIFHTDTLDARIIKRFPKSTVLEYKLPKLFFQFLDTFMPGYARSMHETLEKLSRTYAAEQLFYALTKRVRQLIMVKNPNVSQFEEITTMPVWQITKLKKQAAAWDREDLVKVYKKLFELEKGMKTSTLVTNLHNHIDMLILSEL